MADESSGEVEENQLEPNRVADASTWEVSGDQREPSRVADAAFSMVVESAFSKLPRRKLENDRRTSMLEHPGRLRRTMVAVRTLRIDGSRKSPDFFIRLVVPGDLNGLVHPRMTARVLVGSECLQRTQILPSCDAANKNRSAEMVHLQAMLHLRRLVPMLVAPCRLTGTVAAHT